MKRWAVDAVVRVLCCALAWALVAPLAACDKGGSAEPGASADEAQSPPPAVTSAPEPVRTAFASYEALRAALARDAIAEAPAGATALATAARSSAAAGDAVKKPLWEAVASSADAMKAIPTADADAVRKSFGEVSRALVALLATDAALAEGLHVFRCPMAQGYQKWVQTQPKIDNPYMGTSMLTCGSKSDLK